MLKRLRDSGYKADKLIGYSDSISLDKDLDKLLSKIFPKGKPFYQEDILKIILEFRKDISRRINITPSYNERDNRVWTILIDGGRDNVLLTFYRNSKEVDESYDELDGDYFEIYDGGQFVKPIRKKLNTHSFEVIIQELNRLGIINKLGN